ncbi:2TM domain-containing protein [Flavobacterium selenitireducens]|uniref:2TM domain-containing protein n=1 Tax=Flavobacterium selenitireducens TaxID=2722704 RepID=UPI00168AFE39|nr:2TM domain-containing protein [Flavobacterium selenitireducens]MBD3582602.1 Pr2TM family membrane protein [Flavobacterium selenitireducens]
MKISFGHIWRLLTLGTIIFAFLVLLNWSLGSPPIFDIRLLWTYLYTLVYTFLLYFANAVVFRFLEKKFKGNRFSPVRLILGILLSFVASLVPIFLLRIFEDVVINGRTVVQYFEDEKPSNYIFAIGVTFVITITAYVIGFYKAYKENQVKQQQMIAGTASAQFESLKNQIDPHFLFNSLNVLSSLIEENQEAAQKFTTSLSKVYRYVLEQKDKELVSVEEELSFAKTYMNLLKMRFENSLFYELPKDIPGADAKVVPLSLQLLLENTVKHNVVSEKRPLHIRIYIEADYLCVENQLQKKEVLQDRQGVGLQNIVDRYGIMTRRKVLVEQTNNLFAVKIPILTKQITIMETQFKAEENSYYKAQKKVEMIKDFYGNVCAYVLFNAGLLVLNLLTSPEYLWFLWSAAGWGIGVLIHAAKVFDWFPFFGNDWEERKIREIIEKEKSNKWK